MKHKSTAASAVCAVWLALLSSVGHAQTEKPRTVQEAIRPFNKLSIPEEKLVDLRRRIAATQWPEKETVADHSQGVPLAAMQELARHWATDYDWRKVEARLNA